MSRCTGGNDVWVVGKRFTWSSSVPRSMERNYGSFSKIDLLSHTTKPTSEGKKKDIGEQRAWFKKHQEVKNNTIFYYLSSGKEIPDAIIDPTCLSISILIMESSSALKEWEKVHEGKYCVHFAFEGNLTSFPNTMSQYKMGRTRDELFGEKNFKEEESDGVEKD